jgi:DNA-binding CsgD family transcriptional regulator
MKVPEPDVSSLLNAIYAFEIVDHAAWLTGVTTAASACVPHSMSAHSALLRYRADVPDFVAIAPHNHMTNEVRRAVSDPAFARVVSSFGTVGLAAPALAQGHLGSLPQFVKEGLLSTMPADILMLQAQSDDASGAMLAVYFEEPQEALTPSLRDRWTEIASHLAAAARLRLSGLPKPAVVLDEKHRVVDANGNGASKSAREALRTAARAVDKVRGRKVKDAQEALAIWRVLTDGRWTIADDFDGHGRRTIVAYDNVPLPSLAFPKLSLRERQVICFVALGHTNKQIGYELGVSPSSVATHLSKAMRKLGVKSRAALVAKVVPKTYAPA